MTNPPPRLPPVAATTSDAIAAAYLDALPWLQGVDGLAPSEAEARLPELRARHGGLQIDLVWEREPYADTVGYELLLHDADGTTVSVAHCPDRGLPWPLRGIQRHSEAHLVRVNGTMMRIEQAIQLLDFIWRDVRLADTLVDAILLQQHYEAHDIGVSDEQLQAGMDEFRRRRGLHTAAQTQQWLRRHGITQGRLEFFVADRVRHDNLREAVVGPTIAEYFAAHRDEFERIVFADLTTGDRSSAIAIAERARAGTGGILDAARELLLDPARAPTSLGQELLQVRRRWELPEPLARALLVGPEDTVIGPIDVAGVFHVLSLSARQPATLDAPTREHVAQRMFAAWLAARRSEAVVEWYWGRREAATIS